jgi:hypothetical protein
MMESSERENPEANTADNIRFYGSLGKEGLSERIRALDGEWDMEKSATVFLAGAGLFGMVMGLIGSRLWRVLTWASLPCLFLLAQDKWRPSESILKSLGLRSRKEILAEKYALKALRGDFKRVEAASGDDGRNARNTEAALEAVQAD